MALSLTAREGQKIDIGGIKIWYRRLARGSACQMKVFIEAPREVIIHRSEEYDDGRRGKTTREIKPREEKDEKVNS